MSRYDPSGSLSRYDPSGLMHGLLVFVHDHHDAATGLRVDVPK
jgi:hypothetical protein